MDSTTLQHIEEHSLVRRWGPPDLMDPLTRVAAWFTEPCGVVTQLGSRKMIDLRLARYLTDSLHNRVREHFRGKKTFALHDWSTLEDFEYSARTLLVTFCLSNQKDFADTGIVHPPLNALWNLAINAAKTGLEFGHFPFRVFPNLDEALRAFQFQARTRLRQLR